MPSYVAPLADMRFLLRDVFAVDRLYASLPSFADLDLDTIDAVLGEAAKFCAQTLSPLHRSGDEVGCVFTPADGAVVTPPGVKDAYAAYVDGGWSGLSLPAAWGGQGLPFILQALVDEMIAGANMCFGLFPGLTHGAAEALLAHASDDLKARYLPQMVAGTWTGAMDLTEPQAGTDLGLLRTKAVPAPDHDPLAHRVTGTKIFISAGEHDLADNIIHLVLARLPDAPAGVRGISLFLVPKLLPDGARNAVSCGAIEHKMGIKGSPTCLMNFDGAIGWLVGAPHQGLAAMFTMMNAERLFVGVQAIGVAQAAYDAAAAYAKDRRQGRDLSNPAATEAAPLIAHADVRRNLLTARCHAEGLRALALWAATQVDLSHHHPDAAARADAADLAALITPVVKAAASDLGFEATVAAQQVFGGHGYIREWGMEQFVRDVRITQIYEGANGVQALDLVGRKLTLNGGAPLRRFQALLAEFVTATAATTDPDLAAARAQVERLAALLATTTDALLTQAAADPHAAGAGATAYLRLFALTAQAWLWGRMIQALAEGSVDNPLRPAKLATARFFFARLVPQADALAAEIRAPSAAVMGLAAELF